MSNREPFVVDERYHCYNRGVEKRDVFLDHSDYERFLVLLYVCNSMEKVRIDDLQKSQGLALRNCLTIERTILPISLSAYCLMPNHFHLLVQEKSQGGVSYFMQKLMTAYTMYFNKKYSRSGPLFAGVFKSKHLYDDRYFKRAWSYVHLNPAELFEKRWKKGIGNIAVVEKRLQEYEYFSFPDFLGSERAHRRLLASDMGNEFDRIPTIREMLEDSQGYYREIAGLLK
jgi:putative transposase